MEKRMTIEGSNCTSFSNALHAQFHSRMRTIVSTVALEKIHVSAELMKEWNDLIEAEISINREATADIVTRQLLEKDGERDSLVTYLFDGIRHEGGAFDVETRAAAERLSYVTGPYAGLQKEAFDVETLHIVGLLEDLDKAEVKPDVTKLRLTETVERLRTVNAEYQQLRASRTEQRGAAHLPVAKKVRPQTDEAYYSVCAYIEASWLLGTAEDRALLAPLIDHVNQFVREMKTAYRQSQAQKKRGGDEPSEPASE